jgi:hypothetical protein
MIEIEKYACNDGNEARARERHYYDLLNSNLNTIQPFTTIGERKERNIINCKIYNPLYYQNNKEKIIEQVHKYAEANKPKIKERNTKYRDTNNDKIKAHKSKICVCECGLNYTHCHLQRHLRSKTHTDLMAQKAIV